MSGFKFCLGTLLLLPLLLVSFAVCFVVGLLAVGGEAGLGCAYMVFDRFSDESDRRRALKGVE